MILSRYLIILLSCFSLQGCFWGESTPPGRIRVRNDSQDSSYNTLTVYGGGINVDLKPGESKLMPKGTFEMTFIRRYKDFVRQYRVQCPRDIEDGITIKLIDVHLNRISGGCKTVQASKT